MTRRMSGNVGNHDAQNSPKPSESLCFHGVLRGRWRSIPFDSVRFRSIWSFSSKSGQDTLERKKNLEMLFFKEHLQVLSKNGVKKGKKRKTGPKYPNLTNLSKNGVRKGKKRETGPKHPNLTKLFTSVPRGFLTACFGGANLAQSATNLKLLLLGDWGTLGSQTVTDTVRVRCY